MTNRTIALAGTPPVHSPYKFHFLLVPPLPYSTLGTLLKTIAARRSVQWSLVSAASPSHDHMSCAWRSPVLRGLAVVRDASCTCRRYSPPAARLVRNGGKSLFVCHATEHTTQLTVLSRLPYSRRRPRRASSCVL